MYSRNAVPADLLRQRLGADHDGGDRVPDGDVGGDVDLLRRVPHGPPDDLVHQGIDVGDEPSDQRVGRDQNDGARGNGEDGDDGGREGAEGHERNRALVGALRRATTSVPKNTPTAISAPTANRISRDRSSAPPASARRR